MNGEDRLAVVPVRHGALPAGSLETVAECDGQALLAGSAPDPTSLAGVASTVTTVELGSFRPYGYRVTLDDVVWESAGTSSSPT